MNAKAAFQVALPTMQVTPKTAKAVDGGGYLIARGDFSGPVGPGFWDRDK